MSEDVPRPYTQKGDDLIEVRPLGKWHPGKYAGRHKGAPGGFMVGTHDPWSFTVSKAEVEWMTPEEARIERAVLHYRRKVERSLAEGNGVPE